MVSDWWMTDISINDVILWRIQLNALLLLFAIGAFTLFVATLFDEERRAFSLAGSVLVLSIVLTILSELSDKTEWLRYLSVFSLFNTTQLLEGTDHFLLHSILLLVLCLVFLTEQSFNSDVGVCRFDRKWRKNFTESEHLGFERCVTR